MPRQSFYNQPGIARAGLVPGTDADSEGLSSKEPDNSAVITADFMDSKKDEIFVDF